MKPVVTSTGPNNIPLDNVNTEWPHLHTHYIRLYTYNSFPRSKNLKLNQQGKAQIASQYQLVEPKMFSYLTFHTLSHKY